MTSKEKKIIGFNLNNLFDNNLFVKKTKNVTLSFNIKDIEIYEDTELLKLSFFNNLVVRVMKFNDKNGNASATFDIVDDEKKEIILTTDKIFVGGLGIAETFYKMNYITQWEIPILTKLCRGFVFGDIESIRNLIENYYLKINKDNEWKLKNLLGL